MNGSAIFPINGLLQTGALSAEQAGAPAGIGFSESLAAALSGAVAPQVPDQATSPKSLAASASIIGERTADAGGLAEGIIPGLSPGQPLGLEPLSTNDGHHPGVGNGIGAPLYTNNDALPSNIAGKGGSGGLNQALVNPVGHEQGISQPKAPSSTDPLILAEGQTLRTGGGEHNVPIATVVLDRNQAPLPTSPIALTGLSGQTADINPEIGAVTLDRPVAPLTNQAEQGELAKALPAPAGQALQPVRQEAAAPLLSRSSGETAVSVQALSSQGSGPVEIEAAKLPIVASTVLVASTRPQSRQSFQNETPINGERLAQAGADADRQGIIQIGGQQAVDGQTNELPVSASAGLASWKEAASAQPEGDPTTAIPASAQAHARPSQRDILPDGQAVADQTATPTTSGALANAQPSAAITEPAFHQRGDSSLGDGAIPVSAIDGGGAPGDISSQRLDVAIDRLKAPMQPPAAGAQVALQIIKSFPKGVDRIAVQLHPAELGAVEVQLDIERSGRVSAVITAERPETLELLQRDSRLMERSLGDSGLKLAGDGLSFALKQDQQQHQHQQQGQSFQERAGHQHAAPFSGTAYGEAASDSEHQPSHLLIDSRRLLDIRT